MGRGLINPYLSLLIPINPFSIGIEKGSLFFLSLISREHFGIISGLVFFDTMPVRLRIHLEIE